MQRGTAQLLRAVLEEVLTQAVLEMASYMETQSDSTAAGSSMAGTGTALHAQPRCFLWPGKQALRKKQKSKNKRKSHTAQKTLQGKQ